MESYWQLLAIFLGAYLVGSIPLSYLFVRLVFQKDLRRSGTGDLDALNAFRLTRSKGAGLLVAVFNIAKGALPVLLVQMHWPENFPLLLCAVGGVILGDVFSVWLRFDGSRGLSVATGALLFVQPVLVALWIVLFLIFFVFLRQHIIASLCATFGLPLIVFFTRDIYFTDNVLLLILLVSMLVFQRHLARIPDLIEKKRAQILNGEKK